VNNKIEKGFPAQKDFKREKGKGNGKGKGKGRGKGKGKGKGKVPTQPLLNQK